MNEQIYLDISNYRKEIFGEIIPTDTKISTNFPDELRNFPFNKKNFDFFDLRTNMAKYTKTPEKYWNKNYDHGDKITRLVNKISDGIKFFNVRKIIDGTENKNVIKYYQKVYMIIDIFITMYVDTHKNIINLSSHIMSLADSYKFVCRFVFYISIYFIRLYHKNSNIQNFIKTVRDKITEFLGTTNITNYYSFKELENYSKYLDNISKL
ncbi:hypothetical protein QJ854_gp270 [Moumouvirus goulette]|uniref:Uncharacterized protein n=1 Tax=Moumouvirus goulette TaxID=1247379 RepID=M1PXL9_9VIRU|nr:hypothetical protein QJ854_gp270 [Moumouvirus goulette]AGF85512.1 hypothetical protein glt_00707 [Moumouvirus goulette]